MLFLRAVNPWQSAGKVPDIGTLMNLARRLLDANKDRYGHITTVNQQRGQAHWVYGRRGRPCGAAARPSAPRKRGTGSPAGAPPASSADREQRESSYRTGRPSPISARDSGAGGDAESRVTVP